MLKLTTREGNEIFMFQSVAEIDEYVEKDLFKEDQDAEFIGEEIHSWDEVQQMCQRAWERGITTMQAFVARLRAVELPEIKDVQVRTTYTASDGDLDFERLMAGNPMCYRKTERKAKDVPTEVTVVIDTTTPCFEKSENILWRGAAAIALTHILEEKGYKVELWVVNGSNLYRETQVMTACCLKRPGDPLDSSTLVNTVSGWFYRTAIFTLLYTICDKEGQHRNWGFGRCYTPVESDLDLITVDEMRVYSAGVFSFDGALDIILGQVHKLAVKKAEDGGTGEAA